MYMMTKISFVRKKITEKYYSTAIFTLGKNPVDRLMF